MRLLSSERVEVLVDVTYLGYIPRLDLFLPPSRDRASARFCSGNDKTDSVATLEVAETREDRGRRERGREEEASFYGALNSDEVARSITEDPNYILEQINRPRRDGGGSIGGGEGVRKGKTGRRHF